MVAVDGVDAHGEHGGQDPVVLGVPGEGEALEAVEQGGEAAGPVGGVEVDGVDAGVGQVGRPPLGPLLHAPQAGGVDQPHVV